MMPLPAVSWSIYFGLQRASRGLVVEPGRPICQLGRSIPVQFPMSVAVFISTLLRWLGCMSKNSNLSVSIWRHGPFESKPMDKALEQEGLSCFCASAHQNWLKTASPVSMWRSLIPPKSRYWMPGLPCLDGEQVQAGCRQAELRNGPPMQDRGIWDEAG